VCSDHGLPWKKSDNSTWHFVKFLTLLRQITANSVTDSEPKENRLFRIMLT